MSSEQYRLTLEGEALDVVRRIARQRDTTEGEVVRQAISHELWLSEEANAGSRIVAECLRDNERRELDLSAIRVTR